MAEENKPQEIKPISPLKVDSLSASGQKPATANPVRPAKVAAPKPAPVKEVKPVTEVKDPKGMFDYTGCQTHVVKAGETLLDIAQHYVVALQQLRYFNHIKKGSLKIKVGQTLYIPKKPINVPYGK